MLIPLQAAQFNVILRIGGRTFNKVIDPDVRDKGIELFATDQGVVVRTDGIEALVSWSGVQHAEAARGYSFVNGRALPTISLPGPKPTEAPTPPKVEPSDPAKRGRPRKF